MKKKLRICMISSEAPPHAAGIGNAVLQLAEGLLERGHSVTVITRGHATLYRTRKVGGVTIIAVPFIAFPPPLHMIYHRHFVQKIVTKLEKQFDLIHMHSPLVPHIITSRPLITTVHSTWHAEKQAFRKISDWYSLAVKLFSHSFSKQEKRVLSQSSAVIAISKGLQKDLITSYAVPARKITVITNSIATKKYENMSSQKTLRNPPRILSISRLVYRKGILDLVGAVPYVLPGFPTAQFDIIGKGPLEHALQQEVQRAGVGGSVTFLGEVAHSETLEKLKQAAVIVIPSHYEGLPLVLLESLALGKAIVATAIPGIEEIITTGVNGILVPTHQPKELAKAISTILSDEKLLQKLSRNAYQTAKRFDSEEMISKTEKLYQEVLGDF